MVPSLLMSSVSSVSVPVVVWVESESRRDWGRLVNCWGLVMPWSWMEWRIWDARYLGWDHERRRVSSSGLVMVRRLILRGGCMGEGGGERGVGLGLVTGGRGDCATWSDDRWRW